MPWGTCSTNYHKEVIWDSTVLQIPVPLLTHPTLFHLAPLGPRRPTLGTTGRGPFLSGIWEASAGEDRPAVRVFTFLQVPPSEAVLSACVLPQKVCDHLKAFITDFLFSLSNHPLLSSFWFRDLRCPRLLAPRPCTFSYGSCTLYHTFAMYLFVNKLSSIYHELSESSFLVMTSETDNNIPFGPAQLEFEKVHSSEPSRTGRLIVCLVFLSLQHTHGPELNNEIKEKKLQTLSAQAILMSIIRYSSLWFFLGDG